MKGSHGYTINNLNLAQAIIDSLPKIFPVDQDDKELTVTDVKTIGYSPQSAIKQITKAKVKGGSYKEVVKGTLILRNKKTKKILDKKDVILATVPAVTPLGTFVLKGTEYTIPLQIRLRPGIYPRRTRTGELEAHINIAKGMPGFRISFDPRTHIFSANILHTKVPLYSILKLLKVPDSSMEQQWGRTIFSVNKQKSRPKDLQNLKRLLMKYEPEEKQTDENLRRIFHEAVLDSNTTKTVLGKSFPTLSGDALLTTSKRMLQILRGEYEAPSRDAIINKSIVLPKTLLSKRIEAFAPAIKRKIAYNLHTKKHIADIWDSNYLTNPVNSFFTVTDIIGLPRQANQLDILDSLGKTTPLGEGGISNISMVTSDAKALDESHIGILDPFHTPESDKAGVTLNLTTSAYIVDEKPSIRVMDRHGNPVIIPNAKLTGKMVALPDQIDITDKGFKPKAHKIYAIVNGTKIEKVDASKVDYAFKRGTDLLDVATSLIPAINTNSGPRVAYAAKHLTQAVSLVDREEPLVQSGKEPTMEDLVGKWLCSRAPERGKVIKVSDNEIVMKLASGKLRHISLYNHYPLNNDGSFLTQTPVVKKGDEVKPGQILAYTNYTTPEGTLALGTNLLLAYLPLGHRTFEDSVVISESAAKKLTSQHEYVRAAPTSKDTIHNLKRYVAMFPDRLTPENKEKLDSEGIIKKGTVVKPGEALVVSLQPRTLTKEDVALRRLGRQFMSPYTDHALRWEKHVEGKVIDVIKTPHEIRVLVATKEPARLGDKLCYKADTKILTEDGWKFLSELTLHDKVATFSLDHSIHFEHPEAIHKYPKDESPSVRLLSSSLDLTVSMKHKHVCFVNDTIQLRQLSELKGRFIHVGSYLGGKYYKQVSTGSFSMSVEAYAHLIAALLKGSGTETSVTLDKTDCHQFSKRISYEDADDKIIISDPALVSLKFDLMEGLPSFLLHVGFAQRDRIIQILLSKLSHTVIPRRVAEDLVALGLLSGIALHAEPVGIDGAKVVYGSLTTPVEDIVIKHLDDSPEMIGLTVSTGMVIVMDHSLAVISGNSGRYGNKGVISAILPDDEMPRTKDGKVAEILQDPIGVGGRMNMGQLVETALSQVAEKEGKPLVITSFENSPRRIHVKGYWRTIHAKDGTRKVWVHAYDRNISKHVLNLLKAEGIPETEELFDANGKSLGQIKIGKQYILKLIQQADKKMSARAGGPGFAYDSNMEPAKKHGSSGQSVGILGLYTLLAHGAVANLREMQTYKSDASQDDVWTAIQAGEPLPIPRVPWQWDKFVALLAGLGVDVKKEGSEIIVTPMTDKQILAQSNGEVKDPGKMLMAKDLKPEAGGLFDKKVFGGFDGKGWGHITLSIPIPNPLFADAIQNLLGLKAADYLAIAHGEKGIDKNGNIVDAKDAVLTGGAAFEKLLGSIDVDKEISQLTDELPKLKGTPLSKARKKLKILKGLKEFHIDPKVYILHHIPVLPPVYRPISVAPNGDLIYSDFNTLYKAVGLDNNVLKEAKRAGVPADVMQETQAELYDAVAALFGLAGNSDDRTERGIAQYIAGTSPKYGFFQKSLIKRRQDLSAYGVVVPDVNMHMDQLGIPYNMAKVLYKPFIVKRLVHDFGRSMVEAEEDIANDAPIVRTALEAEMAQRPILMKREPSLHKYNILAYTPKIVSGGSIHVNPLVVGGYNMDFDGDTVALYVPLTHEAIEEAYKMKPSANLLTPATGKTFFKPSLESALGLFLLSEWGKPINKKFKNAEAAMKAYEDSEIKASNVITVNGKKTTAGRLVLASVLPDSDKELKTKILTNPKFLFNSKTQSAFFVHLAKIHKDKYSSIAEKFLKLGFNIATKEGFTVTLKDLSVFEKQRKKLLDEAQAKMRALPKNLTQSERAARFAEIYGDTIRKLEDTITREYMKKPNNFFKAYLAGTKMKMSQLRQLVGAPILTSASGGQIVQRPIETSYGEGMDWKDFLTAAIGARKSIQDKVQEVQTPGIINKHLETIMQRQVVTDEDCGTSDGWDAPVDSNLVDRYLAKPVKLPNGKIIKKDTLITPEVVGILKKYPNKIRHVSIHSPITCESQGVCKKAVGKINGESPRIGQNVGIISAQSIGERGVQLAMRSFHTAGVPSKGIMSNITRLEHLLKMPQEIPDTATLSETTGKVTKIEKDPSGGHRVWVGDKEHFVQPGTQVTVHKGQVVHKGDKISAGFINPRQLLELKGIDAVRRHLYNELYNLYKGEGIKPVHIENLVRALTSSAKVIHAPDDSPWVFGDVAKEQQLRAWNKKHPNQKVEYEPTLVGMDLLPLETEDDFLARLAYQRIPTVLKSTARGAKSSIHGKHPIPGLAYAAEFGKPPSKEKGPY